MSKLVNEHVWKLIIDYWHSKITAATVVVGTFLTGIYFFSNIDPENIPPRTFFGALIVSGIVFLIWYVTTKVPRTTKGKIGFVVAIVGEDEDERKRIENDFISTLRAIFDDPSDLARFQFLLLPKWHSAKIVDSDIATQYVKSCRAHVLVFGTAKIRTINAQEFHVLRLRQLVVHRPIPETARQQLSREMSEIFPLSVNISRENDLLGLELTSHWLGEASRYFIAVAAYISGDLNLSRTLLEQLVISKGLVQLRAIPGVANLRRLVPQRLSDVYLVIATQAHSRWRESRGPQDLDRMVENIEKYNQIIPGSYSYHLLKAIWHFCVNRDVKSALREINACRGTSDGTWRYSAAFLEAYQGNIDKAIKLYEKAFTRPVNESVPFEVEEFITWVLDGETDKYQLYFCLGLVNLKVKQDPRSALQDFQVYLERSDRISFPRADDLANEYIAELEQQGTTTKN